MSDLLNILRIEVLIALGTVVTVISQLVKAVPVEWTSDHPKVIAWTITAIIVGILGYYEGASVELMLAVIPPIALVAHGVYDVAKGIYKKIR